MDYVIHLVTLVSIFAILGVSLNLVVGFTGLLSLAHAAFYGIGAYATAILMRFHGWNFFASVLVGVLVAMVVALLIGLVLSKFDGDYYALASLGFGAIAYGIFLNFRELTRGPLGIPGIGRPEVFGVSFSSHEMFGVLAVLSLLLIYFLSRRIEISSFGRVLKAIREDEKALQVFGYRTLLYKLTIFVMAAGMAAVAGSLFATYVRFIDPNVGLIMEAILILAIIILGGLGSLRGSILGAVFIVLLPELMRFIGFPNAVAAELRQIVYGGILVLLMLYRPQGLMGEYKL